ncbi:antitoxin [Mycolicibacterium fortuitum]|uniref:Antitoxin n=1 Tax=Mycolicibacterium fortuitum TaxID=1766 RepID=A0ABD6QPJ0_MYCFO|nr:antitoxin [Mycolicibacterium fortuitum]OMC47444.1 antitoxin [Mycolicibacterium fortuitum]
MANAKVRITVGQDVLATADVDAKAAGLKRSELVEQDLHNEHLRTALEGYAATTVPGLNINDYAHRIYRVNRASEL